MIEDELELNEDALIEARRNLGRFVLASNQVDLDPEVMVERGFRFLKDKSFHVSEVYLKKEERIEALCMIRRDMEWCWTFTSVLLIHVILLYVWTSLQSS